MRGPAYLIVAEQGGILTPQDIADSVLFLCSSQASNITGAALVADGGFVLG
ncbi:SDR family oxidoreductase [Synechococcus sp. CBW1107]|uniref:SDR family oxidoreductase n=1 Tax=Synechococcus sp. CBW1107 TaxID=2789857 RepID=UPI0018CC9A34|nr:SDR family oxidoreductase [Synechococcus sp. CBW1107]